MTYQPGPYPQVPPQYVVQQKKSKLPKALLIVVVGIVLLCGVGGCLAGISGKDSAGSQHGTTTAAGNAAGPATKAPPPGINTPVRDGKFEFVVTDVQTGIKEVGDNPYLHRTAQGAYTIVTMTVLNTSKVPYGFSPGNQDLYDTQDRKFSNDTAAAINLEADTSMYANINPGNTITAKVVFDLPADSQPDRIVLHDSMFSGGATVSLR
ncbi:DUF4352 domain-containing protein [Nocardia cerradoensis]|uniref:DUF4352 domain-containing protein n=1 Tax=Nocardia cerradoensis TaxID=85688 RepID=A0A231H4Y1_9NOCA|nr:DUF4352 domain-containing protein [Nocardia cerradoensis]NKY44284.1 DUF4352 domain-containing protein [Nocardia cerradoensis]OXR44003.1 hypothetical protein B7C42_03559 [Nocardia cerradoensis]